jgi:hypothetical protein
MFFVASLFFTAFTGAVFSQTQAALPRGYAGISLGMTQEEVSAALKNNIAFGYRGERDVSLLPATRQTIIETPGGAGSFFARSWFQFYEDKLYIITINLNPAKADHYSTFTSLLGKYGEPVSITPDKSVWQNAEVIMSLEKPLTLKYVDAEVFARLAEDSAAQQTVEEQLYKDFLEGL